MPLSSAVATARICSSSERAASKDRQGRAGKDRPAKGYQNARETRRRGREGHGAGAAKRLWRPLVVLLVPFAVEKPIPRPNITTGGACGATGSQVAEQPVEAMATRRMPHLWQWRCRSGQKGERVEHRRNNSTLVALVQLFLPLPAYICDRERTWQQDENDPGEADPVRALIPGLKPEGGR